MSENTFDLVIIGSGPGGYIAAIRGAQLGLKTALVEKSQHLGGTCLNVGCIPSKALLHSTERYHTTRHLAAAHGIELTNLSISIERLMQKKDHTVAQLRTGIQHLMQANKIKVFKGLGILAGDRTVRVRATGEDYRLSGTHILLATGSTSIELPFLPYDGKTVVSSTEAIAFQQVPAKLAVVGAGAIGLELGAVWARLGADVHVIECLPMIAPGFDADVSKAAERLFKQQGLRFHLDTTVTGLHKSAGTHFLSAEKAGQAIDFEVDKVLVAVGRRPYTEGLGLDAVGLATDDKGRIPVAADYQTSAPGIYAIGDVIAGPMLAHKAEAEAVACVEQIAGQAGQVNYEALPNVIYTDPEIASVGLGESDARARGFAIKIGKFNFAGNGRAIASDATQGFAKVIACKQTDRILGVQLVGTAASELISTAVAHMEYGGSAEDLARTIYAHPTLSEALKEAALAVDGEALHSA